MVLFASFGTCLFPREVDAAFKDKHTPSDPFAHYMAAVHRSQISVTQTLRGILTPTIPYCKGLMHTREISQVSVVNKYSKAPNLCKAKELNLTLPPSYLHQWCVLKSSVGRKSKHCPDPSKTVDKYIKNEFPDKVVTIKLDLII